MMLLALIKKLLRIQSPTAKAHGFNYEFDKLRADRARAKFLKLNPHKLIIDEQRLKYLESLNDEQYYKHGKTLIRKTIQSDIKIDKSFFETFESSKHYEDFIKQSLIKQMLPELIERLEVVTDYNPKFMTYRAIGRFTIYEEDKIK